jgi:hypothetical protein
MPNLGHVANFVASELHHLDVVRPRALASWQDWAWAWACMGTGKDVTLLRSASVAKDLIS